MSRARWASLAVMTAVAFDVDIVADAPQKPVGHARRPPGPQGDLAGPGVVDLDLEDPG